MSYTVGMCGPISVADYKEFISPAQWHDDLPKGLGGTPVNLLCRELLKRGQRLVIFSTDRDLEEEVILEGDLLKICIGPQGYKPARDFFRTSRKYLAQAISREKPDLIHAQWTYEFAMPVQVSGIPHIVTAHDAPLRVLYYNFIPFRIARTLMAYRVISRAKRIISVSPYVDAHLRNYVFYRGKTEVIPNGMPDEAFARYPHNANAEHRLTFVSVLVGWGNYKNGGAAIEAFAKVRRELPDSRLIMFGAGHGSGEEAELWATERNIADGVEFAGQLPYDSLMARVAAEADVLVHPSLLEAQPMAVIEAMVRGIPVIGGKDSGGVPWTLDHGKTGVLVDVRSPDEIAAAMLHLAADYEMRESLVERGRQLARERFHIRAVADAYQAVYDDLAMGK